VQHAEVRRVGEESLKIALNKAPNFLKRALKIKSLGGAEEVMMFSLALKKEAEGGESQSIF
jgi:hypothetical protein